MALPSELEARAIGVTDGLDWRERAMIGRSILSMAFERF